MPGRPWAPDLYSPPVGTIEGPEAGPALLWSPHATPPQPVEVGALPLPCPWPCRLCAGSGACARAERCLSRHWIPGGEAVPHSTVLPGGHCTPSESKASISGHQGGGGVTRPLTSPDLPADSQTPSQGLHTGHTWKQTPERGREGKHRGVGSGQGAPHSHRAPLHSLDDAGSAPLPPTACPPGPDLADAAAARAGEYHSAAPVVIGSHSSQAVVLVHKQRQALNGDRAPQRLVEVLPAEVIIDLQGLWEVRG